VIIDTSAFLADAVSPGRSRAATQILRILRPAAHIALCDDIRRELFEKLTGDLEWTNAGVLARHGVVLGAATWVAPVEERGDHLAFVKGDPDDTMLVRLAEAIYSDPEALGLIAPDQGRFIVSHNRRHVRPGSNYAGFLAVTPHQLLRDLAR
jgi:hypothetical protein